MQGAAGCLPALIQAQRSAEQSRAERSSTDSLGVCASGPGTDGVAAWLAFFFIRPLGFLAKILGNEETSPPSEYYARMDMLLLYGLLFSPLSDSNSDPKINIGKKSPKGDDVNGQSS